MKPITRAVQFANVVARVSELESLAASSLGQTAPPPVAETLPGGGFARALATAIGTDGPQTLSYATAAGAGTTGSRVLAAAESQLGQAEQPPGSNDGPAIAMYRTAVAGAQPGEPWCAYFASWAAQQAGVPLGDAGQGLGSVAQITDWAQRTGRYLPAGSTPQPGDLILFGTAHVGIVESVNADGSMTTIEGNSGQAVSRVYRQPTEATGYVRMDGTAQAPATVAY